MKCFVCGRDFKPTGHGKAPKYCSNACRQKAYKARRKAGLVAKTAKSAHTPATKPKARQTEERPDLSRDEFKRMMDDSLEDVLRMNRDVLSRALTSPDTPPNALPAISRQLVAVTERLDQLEGGDPLLGIPGDTMGSEEFNAEGTAAGAEII